MRYLSCEYWGIYEYWVIIQYWESWDPYLWVLDEENGEVGVEQNERVQGQGGRCVPEPYTTRKPDLTSGDGKIRRVMCINWKEAGNLKPSSSEVGFTSEEQSVWVSTHEKRLILEVKRQHVNNDINKTNWNHGRLTFRTIFVFDD